MLACVREARHNTGRDSMHQPTQATPADHLTESPLVCVYVCVCMCARAGVFCVQPWWERQFWIRVWERAASGQVCMCNSR